MPQGRSRRREEGEFRFRAGPVQYRKRWEEDHSGPRSQAGATKTFFFGIVALLRGMFSWVPKLFRVGGEV